MAGPGTVKASTLRTPEPGPVVDILVQCRHQTRQPALTKALVHDRVPMGVALAALTDRAVDIEHRVGADDMVVVQAVDDRDPVPPGGAKDRRRQVILEVMNMHDIGALGSDHGVQGLGRLEAVDAVHEQRCLGHQRGVIKIPANLEVQIGEVLRVRRRLVVAVAGGKRDDRVAGVFKLVLNAEEILIRAPFKMIELVDEGHFHQRLPFACPCA